MGYSNSWVNATPALPLNITIAPNLHDVLLAITGSDAAGAATFTWPTGFDATTVISQPSGSTDGASIGVGVKLDATGSEGVQAINSNQSIMGAILSFSGIDNAAPIHQAVSTNNASFVASPWSQGLSITTTIDGCELVAIINSDVNASGDPVHSFTDTSGLTWTVRQDLNSGFYNFAVATATQPTQGTITVTGTGTLAAATSAIAIAVIALRPAVVLPLITQQPVQQIVAAGGTATFSVTATFFGTSPSYQWKRNGTPIGGATSSSYSGAATVLAANNGDLFTCDATDSNGTTTTIAAPLWITGPGTVGQWHHLLRNECWWDRQAV